MLESFVGMADLVSNGQVGKAVEDAGVRFKDAKSYLDQFPSIEQQRANSEVQMPMDFAYRWRWSATRQQSSMLLSSLPRQSWGWGVSRGLAACAEDQ